MGDSFIVQVGWTFPGNVPEFFGPFDTEGEANRWAAAEIPLAHLIGYRVVTLASPPDKSVSE